MISFIVAAFWSLLKIGSAILAGIATWKIYPYFFSGSERWRTSPFNLFINRTFVAILIAWIAGGSVHPDKTNPDSSLTSRATETKSLEQSTHEKMLLTTTVPQSSVSESTSTTSIANNEARAAPNAASSVMQVDGSNKY